MTKHTLEKIVDALGPKFNEETVHTAMFLAYAEAIYGVVARDCIPAPLYRIHYDEKNNTVGLDETYGLAYPVEENALDISVIDEIFCCNVRDIPLLLEGETGVGKTFPAMKYISTILQQGQFFSHRLSANAFMNNLFAHFQEGKMVNGMPVIEARTDRIEVTAAGIEDEINRGDSNETLQLFDGEMHLNGTIHKLGIPIPKIESGKYVADKGKKKKLMLVSAQNPANSEDAKFTQTMQLDAAVDNRLLKTYVGNASPSAQSTLWLGDAKQRPHEVFIEYFVERASQYLGIDKKVFSDINTDWLSLYAWITEAGRTDKQILYSALELSDLMISTFSGNLLDYYQFEKKTIEMLDKKLGKGVKIKENLKETNLVKEIHAVTQSFKVPIIFRDVVQLKKLSDVLATLKNVKDALASDNHVKSYTETERYVSIREVAGATALLARNKQIKGSQSPINAINQVVASYVALTEEYMDEMSYVSPSRKKTGSEYKPCFTLFDRNSGIKQIAIYKAVHETLKSGGGVDCLADKIAEYAKLLAKKTSASEDIKNVLIVNSVANLMTLCDFLKTYESELDKVLAKYSRSSKRSEVVEAMVGFYYEKRKATAMVMPSTYQHRIQRTLGL